MQETIIPLTILNFKAQETIFQSPARFKIVAKGRRFGLTRGAANNFIEEAIRGDFKQGLWGDVINSNIDRYVERYFLPHLYKIPRTQWKWRQQSKVLEMFDSFIDFRSAERPEGWEGFGYDKVFLNEAGIILNDDYLWNNAIKPMLWEYKPRSVIGGTPKGMNLFHELYLRGQDSNQPDYKSFHFTSFDNPYLDHDALAEDMKSMPQAVIQQEIYAEFLEDTGVVFRGTKEVMTAQAQEPIKGHMYVMGVDLAKVQDFTVITVYDRFNNNQVYQDRFNTLDWNLQKKKIKEINRKYNNALIVLDATGLGDPIADDLIRDNLPVEPYKLTNESKKELIEKLIIWIEQKKFSMLPLQETLAEFSSFTYDVTNRGRITYNAPTGFHDDIVISHGLAIWGLNPAVKEIKAEPVSLVRQEYLRQLKGDSYEEGYV
jgi:hypothetical protein